MITDLWIENFKGIGKRQHIPLRPITLLFGANSAGKSTVLHALLYLRGLLKHDSFDPILPVDGENTVSLGGLKNLMHRGLESDLDRLSIEVRFRASESQVNFYLNRMNKQRYGRRRSPANDRLLKENGIDPLMDLSFGSGEWTRTINVRFEIGTTDTCDLDGHAKTEDPESTRWLKSLEISIGDETFFDVALSDAAFCVEGEQLVGYVNLLHPIWGDGTRCQPLQAEVQKELANGLSHYHCSQQVYGDPGDSILVLGILENVECFLMRDLKARELFRIDDPALSEFQIVPLKEYMEAVSSPCRPSVQARVDALVQDHGRNCLVIQLRDAGAETTDELNFEVARDRLVGIIFRDGGSLFESWASLDRLEVIGMVRELLCYDLRGTTADRGDWDQGAGVHWSDVSTGLDPHLPAPIDRSHASYSAQPDSGCDVRGNDVVSRGVKGVITWLAEILDEMTYLGPKRSSAPRDLSTSSFSELDTWGNGLAAWKWLLQADAEEVAKCNRWLDSDCGLNTGFGILIETFHEVPVVSFIPDEFNWLDDKNHEGELQKALQKLREAYDKAVTFSKLFLVRSGSTDKRHPQEVGEGITQVVPVVVACVKASTAKQLIAIEQPELHLHPSLAAKLGDLFISTMFTERGARALIETHSEHLILRILRRIRQTTDGELPDHIPPVKPDDVCVLWVDNLGDGTIFKHLEINKFGDFIDRWPRGFFTERSEELF